MLDFLYELHQADPATPKAIIAGLLVSSVCGVMGCFIILRRMSFLADALAHSMLAGVVCGYLLMRVAFGQHAHAPAMIIGALLAGIVTVAMVGFVSRFTRLKEDTTIGIMYTSIFAFGGVLLSLFSRYVHIDLMHFLVGQLLGVNNTDLWLTAIVAAFVLAVVILLFRQLQLVSFDPIMAASIGIPVMAVEYLMTTCTSLVVVTGVNVVGVILVVGLLIIPAATAYLLCDRLSRMVMLAAVFGMTGFLMGYFLAVQLNVAPGSAVVVACAMQFAVVFAFAPRYGFFADYLRRRNTPPQQVVEDVLGCILRSPQTTATMAEILKLVEAPASQIQRSIRFLEQQDHLTRTDGSYALTETGEREAKRIVRAHRLWESYLAHVGAPEEQWHPAAHQLEHISDQQTVDYLDDKLGHPVVDPHGTEIPEDSEHLQPGAEVVSSLLRKGMRAVVISIGGAASDINLTAGMVIVAGERQDDGATWQFHPPGGEPIRVNHTQADAILVRITANQTEPTA